MEGMTNWRVFEKLFIESYSILIAYSFRFIKDRELAKDIVQDVFLELWKNRQSIDFESPLKSHLFKSVYNRSINYLTSKYAETSVFMGVDNEIEAILHAEESVDKEVSLLELQSEINKYLNTISPRNREIFTLSRLNGLKNKEVADKLCISIKTVEKNLSLIIKDLRAYLADRDLLSLSFIYTYKLIKVNY